MRKLLIVFNLIAGALLLRFTISKFAAWPTSVAGFIDMAQPLGIDPTFFRITSGFIIGYAALSFFTNVLIIFFKKEDTKKYILLFTFNIFYAIGAMIGALIAEFALRSSAKWLLVYIAIAVIAISIANLLYFYKKISKVVLELKK